MIFNIYIRGNVEQTFSNEENFWFNSIDLAYWNHHKMLHNYVVNNFMNGVDALDIAIELSKENIQELIDNVEKGNLPYIEEHPSFLHQSIADDNTLEKLKSIITWIEENDNGKIYYMANWG